MNAYVKHTSTNQYLTKRTKGGRMIFTDDKSKAKVFQFRTALHLCLGTIWLKVEKTKSPKRGESAFKGV